MAALEDCELYVISRAHFKEIVVLGLTANLEEHIQFMDQVSSEAGPPP